MILNSLFKERRGVILNTINLHKQDILCPDCGINYIDEERYTNYKKCISCARRETLASTKNLPYIKYIELPPEEKVRLEKQRAQNNAWARKRNNKDVDDKSQNIKVVNTSIEKVPMEEKRTNERIVKEFLIYKNYLDMSYVSIKTTELYGQYLNFCSTKKYGIMSRTVFYNILLDVFGFSRKMSNGCNYIYKGEKSNKSVKIETIQKPNVTIIKPKKTKIKKRVNQVYTDDIVSAILELSSTDKTVTELRNEIVELFPDANITTANFNNIIVRKQVPHKPFDRREARKIVISDAEYEKLEPIANVEIADNTEVKSVSKDSTVDADGDPIRLVPIKGEVVSVLDERFKKDKCRNPLNYTISDYINMLEMFDYLSNHIDTLIKFRDRQFSIVNDYQFDIVHEMENELADDGDTYFQDKMYVLRDYRRYMEIDYKALNVMKPLINTMKNGINPNNPVEKCINSLKQLIQTNGQPKFVPRVDVGMAKKYDWALLRNSFNKRIVETMGDTLEGTASKDEQKEPEANLQEQLMQMEKDLRKDNAIETKEDIPISVRMNANLRRLKSNVVLSEQQIKSGFNVYRVSCKISGGGYGVFKNWFKDYASIKEDIAMDFAKQELARLKATNKGILVTDLSCTKILDNE